jgi:membrane associated rhomboid family serine protease
LRSAIESHAKSRDSPGAQHRVPDLNHILLLIAWISPAVVLVRSWRGGVDATWRRVAYTVLLVATGATLLARPFAGFIAGGAWFLLLWLPATGLRKAMDLAQSGQFKAARRILSALRLVHPARHLQEAEMTTRVMESAQAQGRAIPSPPPRALLFGQRRARLTAAVAILIGLNVAMFCAEIAFGGSTNSLTLHRLGALEPFPLFVRGEYWRLLTALFLHYGPVHLLVNLFALYFFGPTLENAIGSIRFAICYLCAGLGSCAEVALLWRLHWSTADQLVGASGAVMGIVGAWAAWLYQQRSLAHNRRALRTILMIVLLQTIFDLVTPQVSMAAHLCGLLTGFAVGLPIARSRRHRGT